MNPISACTFALLLAVPACVRAQEMSGADLVNGSGQPSSLAALSPTMRKIVARGRIVVGGSFKFRGFNVSDPATGKHEGYFADIGRMLAKRMLGDENRLEWRYAAGKDNFGNLQFVTRGDVDIIIEAVGINDAKRKLVDVSDEVFHGGHAFLVRRGSPIRGMDDLGKGTRVIHHLPAPDEATQMLMARRPNAVYLMYLDNLDALKALKAGEADAWTDDCTWLYDAAIQDPEFEVVGRFSVGPYGIISPKGDKALSDYLNRFVRQLREEGELEKLTQKWFGPYGRI